MEGKPGQSTSQAAKPRGATAVPRTYNAQKPSTDKFPKTPAEWTAFTALSAAERCAIYLRSIRSMMLFFTVLTVIGIIAGFILALIGIDAANSTPTVNTNPFG